ncbi:uracil-DNA glycosylase [Syntrophomonas wolfei]|jgi:uracil-DNA glycosylase family 4|uniref:Type-4 uracil-DNA glycosylase n=1 Tax=Syntrophomonas wolfei subsp. wolfei (strain DSM 2245B / Goettingen) TaxID=335541 RepID=Q0AVT6_SYNWW|nr:uracil-DNA glycosylase [Syntrophomonas wolfei]ABI69168.1 Uracil-DNA glycosylase-like protein [Syntrophomonas wolfei subsp. wolfei str. Goettingen G311]
MSSEQPSLFELLPGEELYRQEKQVAAKEIRSPFLPGIKVEEAFPGIKEVALLEELARNCNNCRLRSGCRQVVFSDGDVKSRIMFIGEGPGKDEDEQGRPFVGKAGQLLDKILVAAEIPRSQVYISNVVKCRPPGNRLPNPDEVRECRNYLEAQIRIMQPAIIVCLGAMASQVVIDPKASVSKIRGKWFNRQGVKIMATYHPAALLRNPSYKRPAWQDFQMIRDEYNKVKNIPR